MTHELKRQDFTDLEEGSLAFGLPDGGRLPLKLIEVHDLPAISPRPGPFSVLLQGPADPAYAQGMVPLLHPVHGSCDVFVVPTGRDKKMTQYEITFN